MGQPRRFLLEPLSRRNRCKGAKIRRRSGWRRFHCFLNLEMAQLAGKDRAGSGVCLSLRASAGRIPECDERRFSRGGSWSTPLRRDRIRVPDAEVVGPAVDAGGFSSGGYHVIVLGKLRAKRRS